MKRFLLFITAAIILLSIPAAAYCEEADDYSQYLEAYDFSFMEELDSSTYDMLEELGLTDFDYSTLVNFSISDFTQTVKNMVTGAAKNPLQSCGIILVFIILSSFFQSFKSTMLNDEMSSLFSTVSALIIAITLAVRLKTTISTACSTISVCADFIYAFVPVFCIIVATSGNTLAAFSTNTLLLSLAQAMNFISKNVFIPLSNCFLSVGICAGLRSELNLKSLLAFMKKYMTMAISVCASAFVSVLSIKTAVAARADMLGLRSIRFAINSVVPVIGGAISEGLLSIQSYSSLIRSSVGVVGIIAVAVVFLPAIIEVALWRMLLSISAVISDVFGDQSVSMVLRAFCDAMLIMNVILILSMVTTIISIGILIAAKGSA